MLIGEQLSGPLLNDSGYYNTPIRVPRVREWAGSQISTQINIMTTPDTGQIKSN